MSESANTGETGKMRYRADMAVPEPAPVTAKGFKCPNCGGPVNLELPGKTQTIRCPKCSSILEPSHDVLELRKKYNEQFPHKIWIPIGKEGTLGGIKFKCVGMVVRNDDDGGEWSEYLLFNPYHGYRYLVESSGHWTLIEQAPGLGFDKSGRPGWYGPTGKIRIAGKKLKYFTHYRATVKNIIGEFPWQATIGETNEVTEYINPPYQASCENVTQYFDKSGKQVDIGKLVKKAQQQGGDSDDEEDEDEGVDIDDLVREHGLTKRITESNWSLGEYTYPEDIQAAFGLDEMPARVGFGMCEPNPMRTRYLVSLAISALLFVATCGTCSVASGGAEEKVVLSKTMNINTADFEFKTEAATDYLEFNFEPGTIELNKETNVEFDFGSSLNQQWVSLNVFMINEQTGQGYIYDAELSHYYGGSGEDAWSEGGNKTDFTTEKMPAGQYYVFVAGATNVGVAEFKRNLQVYGERVENPAAVQATGPLGKTGAGKPGTKTVVPAPASAQPPVAPAAKEAKPPKGSGKLLPQDFFGKPTAPKLFLNMKAKRDVASIGWAVAFVFWLFGWNIYYYMRYRIKEGER